MVIDLGTDYTRADIENLKVMYKGQGGEVLSIDGIFKDFSILNIILFSFDKPLIPFIIQVKEDKGAYKVVSVKGYDKLPDSVMKIVKGVVEDY